MEQVCENCRFCVKNIESNGLGYCHRYPPMVPRTSLVDFPTIRVKDDWCGEWKVKKSPIPEGYYDVLGDKK